jgi:hypothetical protein
MAPFFLPLKNLQIEISCKASDSFEISDEAFLKHQKESECFIVLQNQ